MTQMRINMLLTGPRKGATIVLHGCEFVNGVCVLAGESTQLAGRIDYLGKCYAAFPEGSDDLAAAEDRYVLALAEKEAENGNGDIPTSPVGDSTANVQDGVQPDGAGSTEVPPETGEPDADSTSGDQGIQASGGGHEDTRLVPEPDAELRSIVAEAVNLLDPENDEHWTSDGLPTVAAVTEAAQRNVSRQEIAVIVPDFTRDVALENRTSES